MSKTVAIIGAGIVGAAAAYFLGRAGARVILIEAAAPSSGATGASDGAVSIASKRPGIMMDLARRARDLYVDLARHDVLQGLFHRRSTYILASGSDETDFVARHGDDLSRIGESARLVGRRELEMLIPGVGTAVTSALEVPGDGHAIGYEVANRFIRGSEISLRRNSRVQAVSYQAGRPECVLESGERVGADAVIIAAGLGSAGFLDLGAVMMPRRGQLIITDRASADGPPIRGHILGATYLAAKRGEKALSSPVVLAIDPLMTGQFLIGGSRENGVEARITDIETVAMILREALRAYPPLAQRRVIRTFAGIRAASIDGLPLVGRLPGAEHVFVATGFEGDGICLGPLMGRLIADMAMERSDPAELAQLDPRRFSARQIRWAG